MTKLLTELKEASSQMKKSIEIDLMLSGYQKSLHGEKTLKEVAFAWWQVFRIRTMTSWRAFLKRSLDLAVSLSIALVALPVMALVAIAVKLTSRGPILYSQTRVGQHGRLFRMYKFRSMRQDAEKKSGPIWAQKNDSRVTPIGTFLRTSHLDELPQLINVIRGEMSLVGPRPERPHFVEEFKKTIPNYEKRLAAKPGVTGLAQIRRRYDETLADVKKKVRYDRLYIAKKMCPFLDFKVILLTVGTMVFRTGR